MSFWVLAKRVFLIEEEDGKNNGNGNGNDLSDLSSGEEKSPLPNHDNVFLDNNNNREKSISSNGPLYEDYLKLDKLLSCQNLLSESGGQLVPDEHLFIITHQAYELWFKQILFDMDTVINIFSVSALEETRQMQIVSLLDRIVKIFKLLVDQILILETMPPLEFVEFRRHLVPASGFQSYQFRLIENKLGLPPENRISYNQTQYKDVFRCPMKQTELKMCENENSLFNLLQKWLERTPGLERTGFNFWDKYKTAVQRYMEDQRIDAEHIKEPGERNIALTEVQKLEESFNTILDPTIHGDLVKKGHRRLSHQAMQGAMMLSFYRDLPRFSQPYQILVLLMDIDSLLTKWRYNHVMLVQRMLGSKQGTGGSSGYMYLRTTMSDRYKIFLDLFNLSTWLIPKSYIPAMPSRVSRDLSRSVFLESAT